MGCGSSKPAAVDSGPAPGPASVGPVQNVKVIKKVSAQVPVDVPQQTESGPPTDKVTKSNISDDSALLFIGDAKKKKLEGQASGVTDASTQSYASQAEGPLNIVIDSQANNSNKKTKAVCTLGPKSWSVDGIGRLIDGGMNVANVELSIGNLASWQAAIAAVHSAAKAKGTSVPVIVSTQGPVSEIYTGKLRNPEEGIELEPDEEVMVFSVSQEHKGFKGYRDEDRGETVVPLIYDGLCTNLKPDQEIFLGKAAIGLVLVSPLNEKVAKCRVEYASRPLQEDERVGLAGIKIEAPPLTDADKADLAGLLAKAPVDYIAAFAQSAADVQHVRKFLDSQRGGKRTLIIARIQNVAGVHAADEILACADGVMVRGMDLVLEAPFWDLPAISLGIVAKANACGKFMISATAVLNSMKESMVPTSTETTDIAGSLVSGADCLLLAGPTSDGVVPELAAATLSGVLMKLESIITPANSLFPLLGDFTKRPEGKLKDEVRSATPDGKEAAMVVMVAPMEEAIALVLKHRPPVPVLLLTSVDEEARRCGPIRSLFPIKVDGKPEQAVDAQIAAAVGSGAVEVGQPVVVLLRDSGKRATMAVKVA